MFYIQDAQLRNVVRKFDVIRLYLHMKDNITLLIKQRDKSQESQVVGVAKQKLINTRSPQNKQTVKYKTNRVNKYITS